MKDEQLRLATLHFADLPAPRVERTKQHPLINVVIIALCAVLAETESFYDIEQFGQIKKV